MPGFYQNTNSIMFTDNVDFSKTVGNPSSNMTTAGQVLIATGQTGAGNAEIVANTLTPGAGITITNGVGTITIAASTGAFNWLNIGTSQTLVKQTGYFCSSGGALSLALPATSSVGDTIKVMLIGSTSWTITQGAGQQIRIANQTTTSGAGGSLGSNQAGDGITLVCQTADSIWQVTDTVGGGFTVV